MLRQRLELEADLARLSADGFCADAADLALVALQMLTPPEQISISDCASQYRLIPNAEGGARLWSATLTPYMNGIQAAMDDPLVRVVAVPGPARTGKTIGGENTLFKRLKFGPLTDVLWYLPGALVDDYLDTVVTPLFDLHSDIAAKLGPRPSDRKRNLKKVGGKFIRYFAANAANVAGKQAPLIVADEIDLFPKRLRSNFRQQLSIRQRAYGNIGKGYLCSHPDAGWTDGIAAVWRESNKGIWYWPCPHCNDFSSPCPTAAWRMTLDYERPVGMAEDDLLNHVEATACLVCPHCGTAILNDEKQAMNLAGVWVFDGQVIAPDGQVSGAVKANETWGFWIHGTMSPFVSWGKLAREYVGALVFFENTRKPERLREVTAKSLGEVYEGSEASGRALDPARLKKRVNDSAEAEVPHTLKTVPRRALFLTAAVDVGGDKFDVLVTAWGHDGESWMVDRYTLKAGPDGRSLAPGIRQKDWLVLRDQVMKATYPFAHDPVRGIGIASTVCDTGGVPGVTWKAREFARQMKLGICRGTDSYKLRLIKGAASKKAQEIGNGREVNRDDQGKPIDPPVTEYDLGVHTLKSLIVNRLAVDAPGPGYVHLPIDWPARYIDEMTNESFVDKEWERRGPNETFDLMVYNEACRQMLKPERPSINWKVRPPPWARPIQLIAPAPPDPEPNALDMPVVVKPPPLDARASRRERLLERLSR
jgi:phage terminase large subunit GpA-like protein